MVILVCLILGFTLYITDGIIITSSETQLRGVVEDNADEIDFDDGKIELDDVDFIKDHVTTLIYSHDGYLLAGSITGIEAFTAPLSDGVVTTFSVNDTNYLIYDLLVQERKYDSVFVRGILSVSELTNTIHQVFTGAFFSLPFFILLSGLGSFWIAKRSLLPLEMMMDTANEIRHSDDLSLRIGLKDGKDEIHRLGKTFDEMFSQLEQSFVSEKQFSSNVSHELRTPTAVILAQCQIGLEEESLENETRETLTTIQNQATKMKRLIANLLNLTRLESGVEHAEREEFNLSELIEIAVEEHESLIDTEMKIHTNIKDSIFMMLDYSMMLRILTNLIDNAIKYGKPKGTIEISLQENENTIELIVKDDGIGISKENQEKIFQRFFQVDSARSGDSEGSMGLGLSMVKQMVLLHDGTISVESEEGIGTSFTLTFPKIKYQN